MLTPEIIKTKACNKWCDYRKYTINTMFGKGNEFFPLTIRGDTSLKDNFKATESSYSLLYSQSKDKIGHGYILNWREKTKKGMGKDQSEISSISIPTEEDFLYTTKKKNESNNIKKAISTLLPLFEEYSKKDDLCSWALGSAKILEDTEIDWISIKEVLSWFLTHQDRSSYYLRELPIKVHTKFIEQNSNILITLYGLLMGVDYSKQKLEDVFSLKKKPLLVRFRFLSDSFVCDEIALPLKNLKNLNTEGYNIKRVFIIENEAVYLSFPLEMGDICIFGGGFQAMVLDIPWLKKKEVYYFGDLDEHGLEILSFTRNLYPEMKSIMMDCETYNQYKEFSVNGPGAYHFENLTEKELDLLKLLRENEPNNNRLEQEKIDQSYIALIVSRLKDS